MSEKDEFLRLRHIRDAIDHIAKYINQRSFEDFCSDQMLQDAVVFELQIIGEAARMIPDDLRIRYPQIPWLLMVGTRNFIVHEYFRIDAPRIWKVVTVDLPKLRPLIVIIIGEQ